MRPRFLPARYLEADNGGGTGQGAGGQQQQQDPAEGLRNALQRANNDAMALAAQLYSENYQLRDRNRQLTATAPAEGSVVLTREQAAQWTAYQQLGAPDALGTQLQQAQQAQQQLTTLQRQQLLGQVAEAAGYKASVLGQLPGAAELAFEVREATVDGKTVKTAYVRPKDGAEVALSAYAQQHWADFLPALAVGQQQTQQTQGTPFPGQQPSGGRAPADPVTAAAQRFQEQRDTAYNPLAPKLPAK